jgi:hypothetical protein
VRTLIVALLVAVSAPAAAAPRRYHFALDEVKATPDAPAEVSVKARHILGEILASRPEFVTELPGAPDRGDAAAFQRYLAAKKLAAYQVTIKIADYTRDLAPNDRPGKSGQILTIRVNVSLVGSKIPGGVLALAGSGGATVMAEVGNQLRPREEEAALDDALRSALVQAVDAAVVEMKRPPPKAAKAKKKK